MDAPLVSIVIPCYNVKKYLRDAVESAVQQTYRNIEIILVDDGSTDGTTELCDSFGEEYDNVSVIHKENGGLSSARNAGMTKSKGEFLYFLDSDDFISDITIESLVRKMQRNDLDTILFGSSNVNENGKPIDEEPIMQETDDRIYRGIEAYEAFLNKDIYAACVPFHFYKRAFLNEFSLTFEDGIIHEDEYFSFSVYRFARRIMWENENYYFRRIREGSIMSSDSNIEKKFDSTVWITLKVANKETLRGMDKDEIRVTLLFLRRIQNLMCARINEMSWAQRRKQGGKYRKCLSRYIGLALTQKQFQYVRTPLIRCITSLYSYLKWNQ